LAGLLLAAAAGAGVRMLWRRTRALAAAAFEAACLPGHRQLVIVDHAAPDAYALPGLPGRVVVSTGMMTALDDDDREAMLTHERAHLACHHYAFLAAAHLAAAVNPLLRPVAYTTERWADERAASECGDRRQVARAVGKAALAAAHSPARRGLPDAVLGLLGRRRSPLHGADPVPRRVAALLAAPKRLLPTAELSPPTGGRNLCRDRHACIVCVRRCPRPASLTVGLRTRQGGLDVHLALAGSAARSLY
jgi:hypothetical protein